MRVFAGPNGSGKSTTLQFLSPRLLGIYLNADDIERTTRERGFVDLAEFAIKSDAAALRSYLATSPFLQQARLAGSAASLRVEGTRLHFGDVTPNSYFASVIVDFMRRDLIAQQASFTFETVMSSRDKVDLMHAARQQGYRVYLYFVATNDPAINVVRVQNRVREGGHDVPTDKIISRYHRSLGLLRYAIKNTDRAYVFDNSGYFRQQVWVAEVTNGTELKLHTDYPPGWFEEAVLS
jgi:predicted ABC-type ATPase